jgi:hypothetical protein
VLSGSSVFAADLGEQLVGEFASAAQVECLRGLERCPHTITGVLEQPTSLTLDCGAQHLVMAANSARITSGSA